MHVDPPKEFPIECAMTLASAARNGTVFDTPRESFVHAWNLLGWGGGTFLPLEMGTAAYGAPVLDDETKDSLKQLHAALAGAVPPADTKGGPLQDFFLALLPVLLAKLQEWLGGLLATE
jgi:hypothetical protein